jgi:protease IV
MKNFLKIFFASCLGTLSGLMILGFCFFFGCIALFGLIAHKAQDLQFDGGEVPSANTILHLTLKGGLEEHPSDDPMDRFDFSSFTIKEELGLDALLVTLGKASQDARIDGLLIDLQGPTGQWAQKSELREALQKFKDSGKWLTAYADTYSMDDYYIASLANAVYMGPRGDVELKGIGMEFMFFGRLLKNLGIEVEILRGQDNDFKSAVEPFSREQMSAENREQLEALIKNFWTCIARAIETSRNLEVGKIDHYVESYLPNSPKSSMDLGLVDELLYRDEMMQKLRVKTGQCENEDPKLMSLLNYAKGQKIFPLPNQDEAESGSIAVLLAQGTIVSDEYASYDNITPSWIRTRLDELRDNDDISALVLRLDSPGGDALASETIWKELDRFKKVKPLIVSMGPTVASGGYYMACAANLIVADPMTLTGSIGVFGMVPKIDNFLSQKLDITVDRVHSHPSLGGSGVLSPLSDGKRRDLQDEVDQIYDTFIRRVSMGRNMSTAKVRHIARGRIWSGEDAKNVGLVDELGGLSQAIELAKEMIDRDADVIYYGSGQMEQWMTLLNGDILHLGEIHNMQKDMFTKSIHARCWSNTL